MFYLQAVWFSGDINTFIFISNAGMQTKFWHLKSTPNDFVALKCVLPYTKNCIRGGHDIKEYSLTAHTQHPYLVMLSYNKSKCVDNISKLNYITNKYLFLYHCLLVLCPHHVQLSLLFVQLGLSFLQVHISNGQSVFLYHQISLKESTKNCLIYSYRNR